MYVSYNWLKELTEFDYSAEELDQILTMLGIEVESVINHKNKYLNFVIGKVVEARKHPDADKLTICDTDTGSGIKQIVCGAPNVAKGQTVVVGLPGAVLPKNGMLLEKRKIRAVESFGMICSRSELEMGDDNAGIWVLEDTPKPGMSFSEYISNDDIILEIGITPNRADCLSHFGIAREIAAYTGRKFIKPEFELSPVLSESAKEIKVIIEDEDKCPRYTARILRGVTIGMSPQWLQNRLTALGMRPVNSVVDVTNLVLMETGQPLHAFDLKKLTGNKIIMKTATDAEKFTTLDGKERILDKNMLMICDEEKSIAIGGVMGGENSEISLETTDILIESAYFDPSNIRKTAKKLGLLSEASYRFERGVDIDGIIYASERAAYYINKITGGVIENKIIDTYPNTKQNPLCKLNFDKTREIIGYDISNDKISEILINLNFEIQSANEIGLTAKAPSYRVDISTEIDLIEEIARLYNYDNIPADYTSSINFEGENVPENLAVPSLRRIIRDFLVPKGYNEILTQNICDPRSATILGAEPLKIANPLGEELSLMRTSLVPSILKVIERNIRLGNKNIRLFELGKTFNRVGDEIETFIPNILENEYLIAAIAGTNSKAHWSVRGGQADFFDIKGLAEEFIEYFRFNKEFEIRNGNDDELLFSANNQKIIHKNEIIGVYGELEKKLLAVYDIELPVYILILDLGYIYKISRPYPKYNPVSPYPGISRDMAFVLDQSTDSESVKNIIKEAGGNLLRTIEIFDVFTGKNIESGKKSLAFNLYFSSYEGTLTEQDIEKPLIEIEKSILNKFGGTLRKN